MTDPIWQFAECKGEDTERWFAREIETARGAAKICHGCPIRQVCLDYAIETEEVGIWGGMPLGMEIEGISGVRLERVVRASCPRGHLYDGVKVVSGRKLRTCSICQSERHLHSKNQKKREALEGRNRNISELIEKRYSSQEIALQLGLHIRTVQRHRANERGKAQAS